MKRPQKLRHSDHVASTGEIVTNAYQRLVNIARGSLLAYCNNIC
jgi:hypothetical protein